MKDMSTGCWPFPACFCVSPGLGMMFQSLNFLGDIMGGLKVPESRS